MKSTDAGTHSFIVKVWGQNSSYNQQTADWRGHITHVVSGERLYFISLEEIRRFMNLYLEDIKDSGPDKQH